MFASFNARAVGLTLPAVETIRLAALAGFGGVDLLVRDLVDAGDEPAALREQMDGLGLRGGAWPLPVHWRGDEATFRRDMGRLPELAAIAATLGLARTATWVLPELPDGSGEEVSRRAATVELHRRRLGAIARVLADHGTRLGLEVIGVASFRSGRNPPFVARLGDLDAALRLPWDEAPGLGVLVDAFHLYAAGEPVAQALAWGAERVVWVHVADLPPSAPPDRAAIRDECRGLPGDNGAVDVAGLLSALATSGYDGPVTAEPLARCERLSGLCPEGVARAVAASLAAVWPPGAMGFG